MLPAFYSGSFWELNTHINIHIIPHPIYQKKSPVDDFKKPIWWWDMWPDSFGLVGSFRRVTALLRKPSEPTGEPRCRGDRPAWPTGGIFDDFCFFCWKKWWCNFSVLFFLFGWLFYFKLLLNNYRIHNPLFVYFRKSLDFFQSLQKCVPQKWPGSYFRRAEPSGRAGDDVCILISKDSIVIVIICKYIYIHKFIDTYIDIIRVCVSQK